MSDSDYFDGFSLPECGAKPPGEFKQGRILINGNHGEHWENGVKVVEFEFATTEFDSLFSLSKYVKYPDFERNEAFLFSLSDDAEQREIAAFANNPYRKQLEDLANTHRNKKPAFLIFTTKSHKLKSKERTQEIKFLEGFLKLEENALLGKLREIKATKLSTLRYQKRAINQLIKSLRALGEIA